MSTRRTLLALVGLLAVLISIVPAVSARPPESATNNWGDAGIYLPRPASLSASEEAARIRDLAAERWQGLGDELIRHGLAADRLSVNGPE
jgi:hypothetical protein